MATNNQNKSFWKFYPEDQDTEDLIKKSDEVNSLNIVKNTNIKDPNKLSEYRKKFDAIVNKHRNYFAKKAAQKQDLYVDTTDKLSIVSPILDKVKSVFSICASGISTLKDLIKVAYGPKMNKCNSDDDILSNETSNDKIQISNDDIKFNT